MAEQLCCIALDLTGVLNEAATVHIIYNIVTYSHFIQYIE